VTGEVCPYVYCQDPSKFYIPAYQPPGLADSKYTLAPECALPSAEYPQPLCPASNEQPAYSAYRASTYGVGNLELLSPTKARWTWYRNDNNKRGPKSPTDSVVLTRDPSLSCPVPPPPVPP
jgi:hypothetical protein